MPRTAFYVLFMASGFAGLIYESIWTHYLKLFLGHAAYAQSLVLVVFMGGMAAGAAWCGRRSERLANPLLGYALVEALIGALVIAAIGAPRHDLPADERRAGARIPPRRANRSPCFTSPTAWVRRPACSRAASC